MPYFWNKEKKINILFIHVPKTGGTSVEKYFANLAEVEYPLKRENIYGAPFFVEARNLHVPLHSPKMWINSLQHMSYDNLLRWSRKYFDIKIFNQIPIRIFTIVRNPYERTISDLFWFNFINKETKPYQVAMVLDKYLSCDYNTIIEKTGDYQPPAKKISNRSYDNFDNHLTPQWKLCAKNEKQLHPEIIYLRTETLDEDMKRAGFSDFDIHENTQGITNYYEYLNDESINLINKFYEHDFDLFNYTKISLEK